MKQLGYRTKFVILMMIDAVITLGAIFASALLLHAAGIAGSLGTLMLHFLKMSPVIVILVG